MIERVAGCFHMRHTSCPKAKSTEEVPHWCGMCGTRLRDSHHELSSGQSHFPEGVFNPCRVGVAPAASSASVQPPIANATDPILLLHFPVHAPPPNPTPVASAAAVNTPIAVVNSGNREHADNTCCCTCVIL